MHCCSSAFLAVMDQQVRPWISRVVHHPTARIPETGKLVLLKLNLDASSSPCYRKLFLVACVNHLSS